MILVILVVISIVLIAVTAVVATLMLTREGKGEQQKGNIITNEQILNEIAENDVNSTSGGETPIGPDIVNPLDEAKKDEMLTKRENTELKIGEDTIWIPVGFKIHEDSANTVDEGIVITDAVRNGNEFVWVPVSKEAFAEMFRTGEVTLNGNTGVTSSYYSNLRSQSKDTWNTATVVDGQYSSLLRVREPDLLTDFDEDEKLKYYEQAGFKSAEEMARAFVTDYKNMRASIEKYGGFYIGRYEITGTVENSTVKPGAVLTAKTAGNWYRLYKACRNVMKRNGYVTSTMIWGCQWDETMNWLRNTKFKDNPDAVDINSSSWGNYSDYNSANGYKQGDPEYVYMAGAKQNTGYSEYWSANKIYDLAGNYFEYTQEAYQTNFRVVRGGSSIYMSTVSPASDRDGIKPNSNHNDRSTRAVLYINL